MDVRKREALETVAEKAAPTIEKRVEPRDYENISKPHVPRALLAVDNEHPLGSPGHEHNNMSVLQQHVAFFDRNHDGVIYPPETFQGFRAIGFNVIVSFIAMCLIHGSMSYATLESWIPNLLFPIHIKNIHKATHGSDTGVYDKEGRFVPAHFEILFEKFAKTYPDRMTFKEMFAMTESQRDALDFFGWFLAKFEWFFAYWLLRDEKGYVSKEAIRAMYDGSIFEFIERQRRKEHQKKEHLKKDH